MVLLTARVCLHLLLVLVLLVLPTTSSANSASLYCPLDNGDPSIRDILHSAVPFEELQQLSLSLPLPLPLSLPVSLSSLPPSLSLPLNSLSLTLFSCIDQFLDFRPTFLLWVTQGRYALTFDDMVKVGADSLTLSDYTAIHVVQESHFRHNPLCLMLPGGIPVVSSICHCEEKYRLSHTVWSTSNKLFDRNDEDKSTWCVRKEICSSKEVERGMCEITTDPARRSCLLIEHGGQESLFWNELDKVVKFDISVPSMKSLIPHAWLKSNTFAYERVVKEKLALVLSYVSLYLFNLVLGMFISYHSRDLAEDSVFQTIIQGLVGVFFGLFVLLFVFQRVIGRLMGRSNSIGMVQAPALISTLYLITSQPKAAAIVRDALYEFWNEGAFGIEWIGKLYFSLCILLSWSLCRYYNVFSEDSSFQSVVGIVVKIIGLLFLSNSSSNREATIILMIIGWNAEHLQQWTTYVGILFQAKTSNKHVANRKKMSEAELNAFRAHHTRKALEDLREYLKKNEQEQKKLVTMLQKDESKEKEANLLVRFVDGSYDGTPPKEVPKVSQSKFSFTLKILIGSALFAGIGVIVYVFVQHNY